MAAISGNTIGKAVVTTALSAAVSVLIASAVVPLFGGSYEGIGMWLSFLCPVVIALPVSAWQFHQSEKLRLACDELAELNVTLDRMHANLARAHAALEAKSRIDAMTGALTREAFLSELNDASNDGRTGVLLLADADNFKQINDTFGHQTGDEALIGISAAIATTLAESDFWGRIGGEEFAIFLESRDTEAAARIAELLRERVEATDIRRGKNHVPVTISIGGAALCSQFSVRQSIADADRRLYRAKGAGRNRVVLDEMPMVETASNDANAA